MNKQEAIETIKSNYPTSNSYTMLKEALDIAIDTLQNFNDDSLEKKYEQQKKEHKELFDALIERNEEQEKINESQGNMICDLNKELLALQQENDEQKEIYVVQGRSGVLFSVTHNYDEAVNISKQISNGYEIGFWKNGDVIFVETVKGDRTE